MLNRAQFENEMNELKDEYRQDNRWVGNWAHSWNDKDTMDEYIAAAWNLYEATATNRLKLTLLGGTEIRMNRNLVRNFGVTAANGIQDAATVKIEKAEVLARDLRARFPQDGGGVLNPKFVETVADSPEELEEKRRELKRQTAMRLPAPVAKGGSILSEQSWTPMLNDALIVGAITAGQPFMLALTREEGEAWQFVSIRARNNAPKKYTQPWHGSSMACVNAWKSFLNSQKQMFFDDKKPHNTPRVFTRELLGLALFGYTPRYEWDHLVFRRSGGGSRGPTFKKYLARLRNVHFQYPTDQALVMNVISRFLFGDPVALGAPWE